MKKLIILLLVIFSFTNIYGQTLLPPAFEITSDTATSKISLPDSNWQMLADPTGKMTLQQVLQSENFQDTNRKIDYHINTYWLRYRYLNKMQKEAKIAVYGDVHTDLYLKTEDGNWQHLKSGAEVPWSERDGLKRALSITINIPAGQEITVYERDHFDYIYGGLSARIGVSFNFTENVIREKYTANNDYALEILYTGLIVGILLLAIIINFFFFGIVREKEYLFFALFLIASAIMGPLSSLGDFTLKDYPTLLLYITDGFRCFYLFFFIHFIRYFLKTFKRFPLWDKFVVVFSIVPVLGYFIAIFGTAIFQTNLSELSFYSFHGGRLGVVLIILITCLIYTHVHEKSVRLIIIAVIPLMMFLGFLDIFYFIDHIFHSHIISSSFFLTFYNKNGNNIDAICYFWMVIILSWVLVRRFALIRKSMAEQKFESEKARSVLIEQQKIELEKQVVERTSELQQSLENLKSTQKQLIQSEKMASLGELTAGIAHEIQNPLNFVNNFSDVNQELLTELKEEADKGNIDEVKTIANDVIENEQKINHHGKRADAIVKGMLQHSRVSTGQKEPTDINALADEYLRLSYHGLRAKDKSFNAEMKTDFDESIGRINIIPQDIGRVLLNLFNNAFYAVSERQKAEGGKLNADNHYEPTVSVATKKIDGNIFIRVKDNGNGIPQKIVDKIFQPFFTTKPTGEGTGLGLSLAYDIVKAHGGDLSVGLLSEKVETKEGEGSEFIILLPVKII